MNETSKILITLLLCAGMGSLYANPAWKQDNYSAQQQNDSNAQKMRREEIRAYRSRPPTNRRENSEVARNENPPPKNYGPLRRQNGRMSPEERSALRQQINEAGQSYYSNSR